MKQTLSYCNAEHSEEYSIYEVNQSMKYFSSLSSNTDTYTVSLLWFQVELKPSEIKCPILNNRDSKAKFDLLIKQISEWVWPNA